MRESKVVTAVVETLKKYRSISLDPVNSMHPTIIFEKLIVGILTILNRADRYSQKKMDSLRKIEIKDFGKSNIEDRKMIYRLLIDRRTDHEYVKNDNKFRVQLALESALLNTEYHFSTLRQDMLMSWLMFGLFNILINVPKLESIILDISDTSIEMQILRFVYSEGQCYLESEMTINRPTEISMTLH